MKGLLIVLTIALAGCSTPTYVMRNAHTGQTQVVGGSMNGSMAGGVIGYHIEKGNDEARVEALQQQGFKVIERRD